jgi:putative protease
MSHKPAFVVGMVTRYDESEKRAYISQRNKMSVGDDLWIITPDGGEFNMQAEDIRDENGAPIESTPHPQMNYSIFSPVPLPEYSFLSKDGDKDLRREDERS